MSDQRKKFLDSLNLLYYEYHTTRHVFVVDSSGQKDDIGRELTRITYKLTKNNVGFFIDSKQNIIIAPRHKLLVGLKHKFVNMIDNIKNSHKNIYILSDKKVKYAINIPVIEIKYIFQVIDLKQYDALIFTSKNGIEAINSMNKSWKKLPSYVIAPQTAKTVKSLGGRLAFTGKEKNGNDFAKEICDELAGQKVLYIGGKKIVSNLTDILNENGVFCDHIAAYETACKKFPEKITLPRYSIIIFSSPSTISGFFKNIYWDRTFKAVSIGETTARYFPDYITPYISETTSLESCVKKALEL